MKLKQLRADAGLTQVKIAKKTGVSQPNYQRWESGSAPIPEDKLQKLANILETTPETILGKHPPIKARLYNNSAGDDLNYYGKVSVHFKGGGASLLLSISDGAFNRLHRDLQDGAEFVTVESLANQTVTIRTQAIADLYFSSEAVGSYGLEHETYTNYINILMPDTRDWEIVEALAYNDHFEEFDPTHVKRVQESIMVTDEQYEQYVARGFIPPEELENERKKDQAKTDMIFGMACKTTYQLSTGQQRSVYVVDPAKLYEAFYLLTDFEGVHPDEDMILLEIEGSHKVIFFNKSALDYVSIPTHQYQKGRTELDAQCLDEAI